MPPLKLTRTRSLAYSLTNSYTHSFTPTFTHLHPLNAFHTGARAKGRTHRS